MNRANSDSNRTRWFAPLLVIFIGALAYSNSFTGPFIFDDIASIQRNPQIRSLIPYKLPSDGQTTIAGRPVVAFSFAINYAISRLHVEPYHVTNLLIHLLAASLLYAIVRRTLLRIDRFARSATWLSAIVAAIWVAHPLDTQSVTYIVQRAESLAALFYLAVIYALIRDAEKPRLWWKITAVSACALGMATKESMATAPLVALLYDRTFIAGSFAGAIKKRLSLYIGLASTWGILAVVVFSGPRSATVGFNHGISSMDYARTQLGAISHYVVLAVWPRNLSLDYYDWPIARHWSQVGSGGWIVALCVLFFVAAIWLKPWLGFLGAWFFLILAPSSSVVPIFTEAAAEQRMYLPLAAVVVFVIVGAWSLISRWKWARLSAAAAGCAIALCLARLTILRNDQYSTAIGIWQDAVAKRPNNTRAHANLGDVWAQRSIDFPRGSPVAVAAAAHAAEQFQIVLALEPRLTDPIFALGQSFDQMGNPQAAEDLYTRSLPKHPEIAADLYVERGNLRARRGDENAAESDFRASIAANPKDAEPHYFLSLLFQQRNDLTNARAEMEKTVQLSPDYKDAAKRLTQLKNCSR